MKRKKGNKDSKSRKKISWKDRQMIENYGNVMITISSILKSTTDIQKRYNMNFEKKCESTSEFDEAFRVGDQNIRPYDIHSLKPEGWVTDSIVNGYMFLLQKRDNMLVQSQARATPNLFFSSMLFSKLLSTNDDSDDGVSRWGKKRCDTYIGTGTNIFQMNKVFWPINHNNQHWSLVVADIEQQKLHYYDSLGKCQSKKNNMCKLAKNTLPVIMEYLKNEHKKINKTEFPSTWRECDQSNTIPQQCNGYDCGVFLIAYADLLSVDESLSTIDSNKMNEVRDRIKFCLYSNDCYM